MFALFIPIFFFFIFMLFYYCSVLRNTFTKAKGDKNIALKSTKTFFLLCIEVLEKIKKKNRSGKTAQLNILKISKQLSDEMPQPPLKHVPLAVCCNVLVRLL